MDRDYRNNFSITKKINFVMGHRVFTQNLPTELGKNKCRHLHGHEYVLEVFLTQNLQSDGMVLDFTYFNYLNDFIQKYIDHKFMLSIHDPLFESITGISLEKSKLLSVSMCRDNESNICVSKEKSNTTLFYIFDNTYDENKNEHRESFILVDFVPTAENLGLFFKQVITSLKEIGKIPESIQVEKIRLYETMKAYVEVNFLQ